METCFIIGKILGEKSVTVVNILSTVDLTGENSNLFFIYCRLF